MVVVGSSFISITESPGIHDVPPPHREFDVSAIIAPYDPIHGKMRYSGQWPALLFRLLDVVRNAYQRALLRR
jgi:hypothetical protein